MRRLLALLLPLALTACSASAGGAADEDAVQVTAAFYPYAFLVERIGGPDVELTTLTRAGAEPHDLELTPQQVGALGESDLVVYAAGFQPAVDEAVEQQAADQAFDVHEATELVQGYVPLEDGELEPEEEGSDPHVWLDPNRYAQVATALAERLGELSPDSAAAFEERAAALTGELEALDAEMKAGLASCERREIVTSHNAFGYLADRYDLEQIAVTGITPEEEPTPRRLADVARLAQQRGVTTVFFEELVSPRTAESLAREVGAKAVVLSPLEGPPETGDYLSAMRTNLATLRTALGCT
ncbi:MAG: zinc transporter substrate-binding protein [Frankiales bacterium]|nr:zinc transporter substrate-binding protein [Frankiales bacterium]